MSMLSINKSNEIVDAIRNGNNNKALNHLYKTSLPQIIKYICANNGDEDEAKDVFQDAVISLFTTIKLNRYDESKDVNGFLFFVARNLWINRVKKRNRQMNISMIPMPLDDKDPLAIVIGDEKREVIDQFLGKLGDRCQQILKYVIFDGMSMKEIAKLMNFAGETVAKSTHYRCKKKLMELVEKDQSVIKLFEE